MPKLVSQVERFKAGESTDVPNLPFTMLSELPLSKADSTQIARNASWQTTEGITFTQVQRLFELLSARELSGFLKNAGGSNVATRLGMGGRSLMIDCRQSESIVVAGPVSL